ncbi:regulatory protein RecX [methanotrophic endosymbiont of Bathymodiolus puteoserpentis (Logatchev)]|jgi:regulatory protein|uniref:regulatory protein RecX n=1 Tax=methanotrophic endosymbiont of Bathymodiolus puteoserpentis (Logatchev) TaxID=343235 RepID=UPI0013C9915F|nr:regulatory protein RecX [methanotrophic endosymbiont of Bathymodiolus puteoserpentis (Logatchev)]SHE23065.1 Regulatory protein RecX [methanotrophic endosymbiont of Bathymodiolus puteoserpentis (Logatchev)]
MLEFDNDLDKFKAIKEACLQYLVRREHSQKELLRKVSEKGFARPDIDLVISELAEQGLQSDARFAESYARSRVHRGFGPLRIKTELQQRGVGDCYFDMAVEDIAGSWQALLMQVYEKKYGASSSTIDIKELLKRSRFLQQRGFSTEMIRELLKNL